MVHDTVRGVAEQRVTPEPVVAAPTDDDQVGVVLLRYPEKLGRRVPINELGGMAHAMFPQHVSPLADKFGALRGNQLVGLQLECIELEQPAFRHDVYCKDLRVERLREVGRPAQGVLGAVRIINTDSYALDCHQPTLSRGASGRTRRTARFSSTCSRSRINASQLPHCATRIGLLRSTQRMWALDALVLCVRAAGERSGEPVATVCHRLEDRRGVELSPGI